MNYPWMRVLKVVLTSEKFGGTMTIGGTGSDQLSISVTCHKYLSSTKDDATVRIKNLSYTEMLKIITGKYYSIDIYCGYQNTGVFRIFSGGVLYISNSLGDRKTNEVIILCSSKLIAKFGQKRLNLSLNSGINMYSAMSFIMRRAGIKDAVISTDLKKKVATEYFNLKNQSIQDYSEYFTNTYNDITAGISSDASQNMTVNVFGTDVKNAKTVVIDNNSILLSAGYPRMTNIGLDMTIIPTKPIMCGDILKVDNSIIDVASKSREDYSSNLATRLNPNGLYRLKEITYDLENREDNFSANLICMETLNIEASTNVTGGGGNFGNTGASRSF